MCFVSLSNTHSSELARRNLEIRPLDELRWRLTQASFNALLLEQSGLWSNSGRFCSCCMDSHKPDTKKCIMGMHSGMSGYVKRTRKAWLNFHWTIFLDIGIQWNSSRETSENGSLDRTIQNRCTLNCPNSTERSRNNLHPYGIVGLDCLDPQLRSIRHTTRPSKIFLFIVYTIYFYYILVLW